MFSQIVCIKRRLACAVLALAFSLPVFAQNYVVEVHGIVCQFCSFGVAKKMSKLDFVDPVAYKKGVKVDIENQSVYFGVKAGATLDQAALFGAIESGGYQPIKVWRIAENGERVEVAQ